MIRLNFSHDASGSVVNIEDARRAKAALAIGSTSRTPIELDPAFRAWCARQNQRAVELGQPLPLYRELVEQYRAEHLGRV
ncbi:MAG: hypothetical protein NVV68_00395 [Dokdonella sp.]|nr:hypothetical protein [Dokdonella sp.]